MLEMTDVFHYLPTNSLAQNTGNVTFKIQIIYVRLILTLSDENNKVDIHCCSKKNQRSEAASPLTVIYHRNKGPRAFVYLPRPTSGLVALEL
jgi:hypothetical protein